MADHEREYTCTAQDEDGQRSYGKTQLYISQTPPPNLLYFLRCICQPMTPLFPWIVEDDVEVQLKPKYNTIDKGNDATLTCHIRNGNPTSVEIIRADRQEFGPNVLVRLPLYSASMTRHIPYFTHLTPRALVIFFHWNVEKPVAQIWFEPLLAFLSCSLFVNTPTCSFNSFIYRKPYLRSSFKLDSP